MWKISLVGHSQVPKELNFPNAEIRIFRAPGGKAQFFHENELMNRVLNWEHDLSIVWLGSNDVTSDTDPEEVFNYIKEICYAIERDCQAEVYVCQVEPRRHPRGLSHDQYKRIQCGINNRIKKRLHFKNIHFNNQLYMDELRSDGVHWNEEGRRHVEAKFRKVIKGFIGEDDPNE